MEIKLNPSNFFHYFIFNSHSPSLSEKDQKTATTAKIILGVFSFGTVQLVSKLFLYKKDFLETNQVVVNTAKLSSRISTQPVSSDHEEKKFEDTEDTIDKLNTVFKNENKDDFIKLIEEIGINTEIRPITIPIYLAQKGKPLSFVEILNEQGADFSKQDTIFGNTPIMWAIANAKNSMAIELIKFCNRTILDIPDNLTHKNVPLHLAIGKGYTTISADGQPVEYSNFEVVKALVDAGANVNLANNDGNTPLHLAFLRRDLDMITYLIEHGANVNAANAAGETPVQQLDKTFSEAEQIIRSTVKVFLLDKQVFDENLAKIRERF